MVKKKKKKEEEERILFHAYKVQGDKYLTVIATDTSVAEVDRKKKKKHYKEYKNIICHI